MHPPRALGDLLYSDQAERLVPESEWVDLVQSIATGDLRALHSLYERTHRLVFTLTMRITKSRDAAEELTLDVFNDVWRRASTYDPADGSVVGWIMNQARSRALDRLGTKPVSPLGDSPLPALAVTADEEAAALRVQGRLLRDALTVLTPPERQAIETAFFSELTYQEVAARLDQPAGTITTRVAAGLRKLRQGFVKTVKAS